MKIYTGRISYKGKNRLDITVKNGDKTYAPTWELVTDYKNNKIREEEYTERYLQLMRQSYKGNYNKWQNLLQQDEIVLCCYCKAETFCHRHILTDILVKLGAEYCGEI